MNSGDLFSLLLFALFIGVPLLSRFLRRGGQRPTPKAPPATRTGLPTTPPTQATQRRDAAKNTAETTANDIGERLEQARRRVREAVEGQTARVDTRTSQSSTQNPTGLESAGDMFRRPEPPARQVPPTPTLVAVGLEHSGRRQRDARRASRPLQVERSLSGKGAKLSSDMLAFGREDIVRGIVWQQILDAPKSKRPWRNPSRHP